MRIWACIFALGFAFQEPLRTRRTTQSKGSNGKGLTKRLNCSNISWKRHFIQLNVISRHYLCLKMPKNGLAINQSIRIKLERIQNVVLPAYMDMMYEKVSCLFLSFYRFGTHLQKRGVFSIGAKKVAFGMNQKMQHSIATRTVSF